MLRTRVIPTLLLKNGGLVKGQKFKKHKYVGDPINAVKIFNEKEVDELVFLDISARDRGTIDFELIKRIASETFMPFAYGGGVSSIKDIEKLFHIGVEKVVLNTSAFQNQELISEAVSLAGSQSIVVSIDVKKSLLGKYKVMIQNGVKSINLSPKEYTLHLESLGVGEIIVTSIDREGSGLGYDINLIHELSSAISIPVIASGGASKLEHFKEAVEEGKASAVAAGDMFTFQGKLKAVLITYPTYNDLIELFSHRT